MLESNELPEVSPDFGFEIIKRYGELKLKLAAASPEELISFVKASTSSNLCSTDREGAKQ